MAAVQKSGKFGKKMSLLLVAAVVGASGFVHPVTAQAEEPSQNETGQTRVIDKGRGCAYNRESLAC
ncbi:MAG: hypothetical protein HFG41_13520 [Coprococcus sp.]|nr:hypothetical protein [Coprococcus sp.]